MKNLQLKLMQRNLKNLLFIKKNTFVKSKLLKIEKQIIFLKSEINKKQNERITAKNKFNR